MERMDYESALNHIHARKTFSSGGPSLDRIRRLMECLGNPQERYRCVHIAGTNGKGSVSAMTDAALRECGCHTGLFTSPYLVDFRERIRIDGALITREELSECCRLVLLEEEKLEKTGFEPVNEFEMVTAIGLLAFARAGVDYAVLEVGLGGRTDATNVIENPAACCITSISLDHTAILGDTLAAIAGEKAGIIKPGCPVVSARQEEEAFRVISERTEALGAPLIPAEAAELRSTDKMGSELLCEGDALRISLPGAYQADNAAAAFALCRVLGLDRQKVKDAFSKVYWPGRLQLLPGKPDLLIDAGHNIAGVTALCNALDTLYAPLRPVAVMAMMRDKDYQDCIPMIARRSAALIGTTVSLPRSLPPEEVCAVASKFCPTDMAGSIAEAIEKAADIAGPDGLVLVCGSVYAAGEALRLKGGGVWQ